MPKIREYLYKDITHLHKVRYRFRWDSRAKRITIKGHPGEAEFEREYLRLVDLHRKGNETSLGLNNDVGTYRGLVQRYCKEMDRLLDCRMMAPATRKQRVNLLNRTLSKWGDGTIATIRPEHIQMILDDFEATPGQANNLRKALKAMFRFARKKCLVQTDPTTFTERFHYRTDGFTAWTEEQLVQFLRHHTVGTKAHLAMQLMISTACRRSDLVLLGPQHLVIEGGIPSLSFQQAKLGCAEASQVTVPIPPLLREALEQTPIGENTFLVTEYGKPFSEKGFGSKMRKWCDEAGLPKELSCHGVRKAVGARLADTGCTEHEIMSYHGHSTPHESEKYTRTANRKRMARTAAEKAGIGITFANTKG